MWIELLKDVAEHKAGAFLDVTEDVARAYQAAVLAKDAGDGPDKILLKRALDDFQAQLRGVVTEVAGTIREGTAGLRRPNVNGEVEVTLNEADKRNGPGHFLRQVIIAGDFRDPEAAGVAHRTLTEGYKVTRGMTEGTGSAGGYTTPVQMESQVFEIVGEEQVIIPGATAVPLGAREVEWPALDQYQAPTNGQSAFYGGVNVFRKAETTQRTATQPKFTKIKMVAMDMTAYTEISRDLVQDSTVSIDGMVTRLFGEAIGWREDWESLNGTGAGQMIGIYNAAALLAFTRTTTGHIKYNDVFGMYTRLLSASKKAACWLVHPYTVQELMQIVDPGNRFIMIPNFVGPQTSLGSANAGPGFTMLGLPVMESEKAPVLGAANDLILVDRKRYLFGRRAGLEIGLSEHFKFDTDQIAIRAKVRNDGQPQLKGAITLADGTSKVSAFVGLAA